MTDDNIIKEILLKEDYVTPEEMTKAENFAAVHHTSLVDYLMMERLITKALLGQALAEYYGIPYASFAGYKPAKELVLALDESVARQFHCIIFRDYEDKIQIATDHPEQSELVPALSSIFTEKKVELVYALHEDIEESFLFYRKPLETRFSKIIEQSTRVAPEIIEEILEDAAAYRTSDIHFEPMEKEVIIRFRIDGVLHEAGHLSKENYENIVNRIKVQTHLRIDEHFAAQDGAMRYKSKYNGMPIDLRVSIVPTVEGEKICMRMLAQYVRSFALADLGLSAANEAILLAATKKPFGMILAVGPTGSGKTTMLYAVLKLLNVPSSNLTTIEDPVEYKLDGVNQIQVNSETNLSFSQGLRSIVRQDPDVILVGEIRDQETAEISVNAALTGHLLLSTFHANDAATAIPRLLDMGVEPFLLSSTLELIIAQRLVRTICKNCLYSYSVERSELDRLLANRAAEFFPESMVTLYRGKGCPVCGNTGYKGRTAVTEFVPVVPKLKELILENPSANRIWELARQHGARTMFEDGVDKVKNGLTTIEEVMRIAPLPNY